jgi:hypothetical protein
MVHVLSIVQLVNEPPSSFNVKYLFFIIPSVKLILVPSIALLDVSVL